METQTVKNINSGQINFNYFCFLSVNKEKYFINEKHSLPKTYLSSQVKHLLSI